MFHSIKSAITDEAFFFFSLLKNVLHSLFHTLQVFSALNLRGSYAHLDHGRPSHLRLNPAQFRHQDARGHPGVEVPLELQQLAHEVQIRGHHGTAAPHVFVGICHCHEGVLHKVGDDNGCRTGHACLAMHQHSLSTLICLLCGKNRTCQ